MKTENAKRLLAPLARVVRRGQEYRATLMETGGVVTFRDAGGRVTGVRLAKPNGSVWGFRALTPAIQHGLTRGRAISGGQYFLGVSIPRRGAAFVPVASFLLTQFVRGVRGPMMAGAEWADPEALDMAGAVIAGQVSMSEAVNWLRVRGVEVA